MVQSIKPIAPYTTQAESARPKWARIARHLSGGYLQHVTPKLSPFVDVKLPAGTLERYEDVETWLFYDSEGKVVGSTAALIQQVLHDELSRSTFLDHAPLGEGNFYVELVPPAEWFANVPGVGRCATNRIGVGVGVRTLGEKASISAMSVHQDDRVVTLVTAPIQHGTFELLLEETESGQSTTQVVVRRKDA